MSSLWQTAHARAMQTQGVWSTEDSFTVAGHTKASHADLASQIMVLAMATEDAENAMETLDAAVAGEFAHFKSMNIALLRRLGGELAETDSLRHELDLIGRIRPDSRAQIDGRTLRTLSAWERTDALLAARTPAEGPVIVRGTTAAAYKTRWEALDGLRMQREDAAGLRRAKAGELAAATAALDRLNKAWHAAWKSEFLPGTPQGDALAGVATRRRRPAGHEATG